MATLKNPSIYDDRSTIGSVDELDEYGVWVKIEPEELSEPEVDNFPDFDADFGPEITLDEGSEEEAAFEDFSFSGEGEDAGFDDVEALRQDIESFPPIEPTEDLAEDSTAFDLAGLASPMAEPDGDTPLAAPSDAAPSDAASAALSTQLLMKIANELSSIKNELSTLKGELSAIHSEKPPGGSTEDAGFFDEEDDDKIALTGDELNNIIHTADFTEETGFDAGDSLADNFAAPDTSAEPTEPVEPAEAKAPPSAAGEEIIYDGLGRPLNRKISGDSDASAPLELQKNTDLKTLQENGVEPMTPAPEDTSYLEEDPLVEESLDLSDAVIEEPDLSDGLQDIPLEEPPLDSLSLIDLENMEEGAPAEEADIEATVAEEPSFEDITFDDLPDPQEFSAPENTTELVNLEDGEIDLSVFEDDFLTGSGDDSAEAENVDELSFEVLGEDAELPVQENVQDNLITEDSFEPIILDEDGQAEEVTIDEDLEQSLPDDMKIELDFPSFDIDEIAQDREADDDKNFEFPGSAEIADAGEPPVSTEEVSQATKMELKDVLVHMDKLLESLPEEKINAFAQSEHYNTYKKLFEELGIQQ
jgi:hypothetical protein